MYKSSTFPSALPLFPSPVARVTKPFGKWIMVNFQLGYLKRLKLRVNTKQPHFAALIQVKRRTHLQLYSTLLLSSQQAKATTVTHLFGLQKKSTDKAKHTATTRVPIMARFHCTEVEYVIFFRVSFWTTLLPHHFLSICRNVATAHERGKWSPRRWFSLFRSLTANKMFSMHVCGTVWRYRHLFSFPPFNRTVLPLFFFPIS